MVQKRGKIKPLLT